MRCMNMAKKTSKLIDALTEIVLWTTDIKDREFSVLERLYNKDDKIIVNAFDLCEHGAHLTISDIFTCWRIVDNRHTVLSIIIATILNPLSISL